MVASSHGKDKKAHTTTAMVPPLVAGIAGGAVSTFVLYPLDLIKVRLQVMELPQQHAKQGTIRMGMQQILASPSGWRGLYQGLNPALLVSAISWGGYFFCYESAAKPWLLSFRHDEGGGGAAAALGPLDHFVAATASGMVMVAITNPLWLIKTRMQLQQQQQLAWKQQEAISSAKTSNAAKTTTRTTRGRRRRRNFRSAPRHAAHVASAPGPLSLSFGATTGPVTSTSPPPPSSPPRPYANMMDAARTIVRVEGFGSFYRGVIPALFLTSHGGIQFVAYEFLKRSIWKVPPKRAERGLGKRSVGQRLVDSTGYLTMGAISKIIASTATYPLQVIKSRLQQRAEEAASCSSSSSTITLHHRYRNIIHTIVQMAQKEGMGGFWRGCIVNALRVAPSSAITFVVYESVMDLWS